jgi:hypothetical protein
MFVIVKLASGLDCPTITDPNDGRLVVRPAVRLAGVIPVPKTLRFSLPPGVAEKVMKADCPPADRGVKTTRTSQDSPSASVVVPDTQPAEAPLWITKSGLLDAKVIAPLDSWPVFVMAKVCMPLDDPRATVPNETDEVELARLPGAMPAPEAFTLPSPPGMAEKVSSPDRTPTVLGVNTTRTVQLAPATSVVTPETQSAVVPL